MRTSESRIGRCQIVGENIATRDTYGAAFKELGEQNKKIVGLEAGVVSSTKSGILGKALSERYFNVGINELDIVSASAGFAREELIPFVNTFAMFLATRGADPIQSLIAYDKLNVKFCGTYCRLSDSYDGANHQAITDLAFVRVIPNITVITVADAVETKKAVFAITDHQGPAHLRLSRMATPVYYSEDMKFEVGKGITVRDSRDMTIITTGTVLHKALVTTELLEAEGIRARMVDMRTIKPIDEELIIECARETGAIVTVEEHSVCGGLGSTVAEVLTRRVPMPMTHIGATDFTESGDYEQLLVEYGYGPESIAKRYAEVIKRE